jgi:hypothetical protein
VHAIINNFDYNDSIDGEDIHRFRQKSFIKRIPAGAWGKGFIPLTQLENPRTGELFTFRDIQELSQEEKNNLYDVTRYANVTFEIPGRNEREDQYSHIADLMNNYNRVTLLLDCSSSMNDDYDMFADRIVKDSQDQYDSFYSDTVVAIPFEAGAQFDLQEKVNFSDLPEYLRKMQTFGGEERLMSSLGQVFQQVNALPEGQRQAIFSLTDEGIQDFSMARFDSLQQAIDQKKCDVYFGLLNKKRLVTFVDVPGLRYEIDRYLDNFASYDYFFDPRQTHQERKEFLQTILERIEVNSDGNLIFAFSTYDSFHTNMQDFFKRTKSAIPSVKGSENIYRDKQQVQELFESLTSQDDWRSVTLGL